MKTKNQIFYMFPYTFYSVHCSRCKTVGSITGYKGNDGLIYGTCAKCGNFDIYGTK